MCVLCIVAYSTGWARAIPITIKCSPSNEAAIKAGWKEVAGKPNVILSLTSDGIEVAGEKELVTIWDNFKTGILHGVEDGQSPVIVAQCTPAGERMDMFPGDGFAPGKGPTLSCKLGEGIRMIMLGLHAPDPTKYIWHATLNRDEVKDSNPAPQVEAMPPRSPAMGIAEYRNITDGMPIPRSPTIIVGGSGMGGSPTS